MASNKTSALRLQWAAALELGSASGISIQSTLSGKRNITGIADIPLNVLLSNAINWVAAKGMVGILPLKRVNSVVKTAGEIDDKVRDN